MATEVFTDLETLARQMNPPYGGAAILVWGNQPTAIVARLKHGFSPQTNPVKLALDSTPAKLEIVSPVPAQDLARASYPAVDVVSGASSISTIDVKRASDASSAVLLKFSAPMPDGHTLVFTERILVLGETVAVALLRTCYARGILNLHLLQGPRPQFVGTYQLKVDRAAATRARQLEPPSAAWWQFWKR